MLSLGELRLALYRSSYVMRSLGKQRDALTTKLRDAITMQAT